MIGLNAPGVAPVVRRPGNQKVVLLVMIIGITASVFLACYDYCAYLSDFELSCLPHDYADEFVLTEECIKSTWKGRLLLPAVIPCMAFSQHRCRYWGNRYRKKKITQISNVVCGHTLFTAH